MTITEKKAKEKILKLIEKQNDFFIIGCGECATTCKTGGEQEVKEMIDFLKQNGKNVTGGGVCETTCDIRLVKKFLRKHKQEFENSNTVMILACGAGLQALRDITDKKLIAGTNTLFLGTTERLGTYNEYCMECGKCTVSQTFGFCTKTRCAKGLVNGPCGNATSDGKCEQGSDKPCVWVEIFNYLKEYGIEDQFMKIKVNNDYSKAHKPRKIKDYKKVY